MSVIDLSYSSKVQPSNIRSKILRPIYSLLNCLRWISQTWSVISKTFTRSIDALQGIIQANRVSVFRTLALLKSCENGDFFSIGTHKNRIKSTPFCLRRAAFLRFGTVQKQSPRGILTDHFRQLLSTATFDSAQKSRQNTESIKINGNISLKELVSTSWRYRANNLARLGDRGTC